MVDGGDEDEASYRHLGGSENTLAFEVEGPTMASCLGAAVEAFAESCGDVHPSVVPGIRPVTITGQSPPVLLRAVLEEFLRLATQGELAIGVQRIEAEGDDELLVEIEAVPLTAARPTACVPPLLSWHDLALDEADGRWFGRVVAATDRRDRSLT